MGMFYFNMVMFYFNMGMFYFNMGMFTQEKPDVHRPLVAELKTRLMQVFPEMATATYPRAIFVTRAVQNGSLSTGWCES